MHFRAFQALPAVAGLIEATRLPATLSAFNKERGTVKEADGVAGRGAAGGAGCCGRAGHMSVLAFLGWLHCMSSRILRNQVT